MLKRIFLFASAAILSLPSPALSGEYKARDLEKFCQQLYRNCDSQKGHIAYFSITAQNKVQGIILPLRNPWVGIAGGTPTENAVASCMEFAAPIGLLTQVYADLTGIKNTTRIESLRSSVLMRYIALLKTRPQVTNLVFAEEAGMRLSLVVTGDGEIGMYISKL